MPTASELVMDAGVQATVDHALRRGRVRPEDMADVRQEIMLELWRAAERFDPSRGVTFRTYAAYRAQGRILDLQRKTGSNGETRNKKPAARIMTSFDDRLHASPGQSPEASAVDRLTVEKLLRRLTPRERAVIEGNVLGGLTPQELASELGIHTSRIFAIRSLALAKMRAFLGVNPDSGQSRRIRRMPSARAKEEPMRLAAAA